MNADLKDLETVPEQTQLDATIERVTFRNEDNGWTVSKAKIEGVRDPVTVTGSFGSIHEGQGFQLFGEWTNHAQYGKQFRCDRSVPVQPTSRPAMAKYLASGLIKGIGPKTAEKIVDHFGLKTLEVLDSNVERLLEVDSIGKKKLKTIIKAWNDDRAAKDVMMFLNTYGISPVFAQKIIKLYGQQAVKIVSKDPYRLAIDIHGIGFRSADQIAQRLGIEADSPERIRAATLYLIKTAEEQGHCYLTTAQLEAELGKTLEIDQIAIESRLRDCLLQLNQSAAVFSEELASEEAVSTEAHYRVQTLAAEATVATRITQLLANPLEIDDRRVDDWLKRFCEHTNTNLSEEQLASVKQAVKSRVFVLTGGPGVGKTTTANAIIRLFKAMGKGVALCAPTGRAAQRLTEVSGEPAKTIHRLLEWNPLTRGFSLDEVNPLTVQALVVDETSMLDVHLADSLFRAIPDRAQVILIGDVDQLPSVGPGRVLRDLIDSGVVPFVKLSQIFRQAESSKIVQNAHAINRGEMPEFDMGSDCKFLEADSPQQVQDVIKELIGNKLPREAGFDALQDVQILSPMNRGELGTHNLNDLVQELLNPKTNYRQETTRGPVTLRDGDKVIQIVNNYDLGVFNGDIGFIENCNVDGGKVIVRFGDKRITYANEQVLELRLAYAITIHKSQGSEFPVTIIPVSTQHYVMLERNLIYTGLTRAKKLALFVGTKKALGQAIRNLSSHQRQSMLIDRIRRDESR